MWADGTRVARVDFPADTKFPQPPLIEHEDPARARAVDSATEDKAAE
jgi:hypothetical protein